MEPTKQEEKAQSVKRMVRVRCLRPFGVTPEGTPCTTDKDGKATPHRIVSPGTVLDVEPEFAKALIKETKGHHTFFGERYGKDADEGRSIIKYAELVTDQLVA